VSILGSASRVGTEREQRHGVRGAAQAWDVARSEKATVWSIIVGVKCMCFKSAIYPFGMLKIMCFRFIAQRLMAIRALLLFCNICFLCILDI
jgi:hypothetical protein